MFLALIFDSVGFGEWFVLLAVLLIVVGPKRLPSVVRRIGRVYAKIGRMADAFKRQIMEADSAFEREVGSVPGEVGSVPGQGVSRERESANDGD